MSDPIPDVLLAAVRNALPVDERARLQDALKRCSPATLEAAVEFRRTGDVAHLRTIVVGVIERYVERELRPKLKAADDTIRLVEDLGIDSLTMMEIVLLAEDVLGIDVSNDELTKLRTLGDIHHFITAKAGPNRR